MKKMRPAAMNATRVSASIELDELDDSLEAEFLGRESCDLFCMLFVVVFCTLFAIVF